MISEDYKQAVLDCKHIMCDLYDEYGDYSVAQEMFSEFNARATRLITRRGK